jgi:hypothetical protein
MAAFLNEKKRWFAANWKALLAVFALGLLPFLAFLASPGQALYASDQLGAPAWRFYFEALRHGTIPQWQTYALGGMPTFDAGFGDSAYPVFIILGLLLPIKTFISWCFVLHVAIAGLCAYYLVNRFFGLNRLLSVALAAAYMFNTNFISHIHAGHTGKFYIMAWLPLSLYLLLRCLQSRARAYHPFAFALSIALMLLPFHPQFMYYVLMGFFLAWAFKVFWLLKARRMGDAALLAGRFWIPIFTGIGLLFFLLYPPMQWSKAWSVRGTGEKTTYEHATSWSMHPEETASLVVPEFGGINERYWGRNPFKLNSEYPGLSVLFLGILGLVLFRKEKEKWFWLWGGVGLLAIIFGLGAHTPLFRLFYAFIPGIKTFRAPSMMLFWLATALLVMSADMLSRLTNAPAPGAQAITAEKRKAWSKRLMQVGFGLAGALILAGLAPGFVYSLWDSIFGGEGVSNLPNRGASQAAFALGAIRSGVLLAALVFATRKWLLDEVETTRFGLALLVITCADLLWVNSAFIRTYDPDQLNPRQEAVEYLKTDTSAFRVFGLPGAYERTHMQFQGIQTLDGWTDNEYRVYREFRGGDYQQNPNLMAGLKQNPDGSVSGSPFLDMLNAKYLAYRLQGDGALHLAPNTSVLPRAWFAPAWESLPDSDALGKMLSPGFDPRALAYVSTTTAPPSGFAAAGGTASGAAGSAAAGQGTDSAKAGGTDGTGAGGTSPVTPPAKPAAAIRAAERGYNRLAYDVEAGQNGIFVLSELWFEHWHLKVDGKEAPLLRVNYALRGAALTPGTHRVEMEYASPWIRKGMAVAGLSLAALLIGTAGLAFAQRSRSGRPARPA